MFEADLALNSMSNTHNDQKDQKESETGASAISERTPVRLGLFVGGVVGLVSAAWFLGSSFSKIETKLDMIVTQNAQNASLATSLEKKVTDHEKEDQAKWTSIDTRVRVIETSGSEKTREIEKALFDLRAEYKLHEALSKQQGIK